MQLPSKMRFISAQLVSLFRDDLWLRNASHANALAQRLFEGISHIDEIEVERPQANALFPILDPQVTQRLQEQFRFYVWDQAAGQVRWMTSWDSTEQDVDVFVEAVKEAVTSSNKN